MQAAHLPQHVHHVTGPLHHLLLDFLCVEHFDPHRHVLNSLVSASRGHRDVLFDRRASIQFDDHRLLLVRLEVDGGRRRRESVFDDDDAGVTGRQRDNDHALRVRLVRGPVDDDRRETADAQLLRSRRGVAVLHLVNPNALFRPSDPFDHIDRLFAGRATRTEDLDRMFCCCHSVTSQLPSLR